MRSLLVFGVLFTPLCFAQGSRDRLTEAGGNLEAAAAAGAANAARPGDENMSCEQLQLEVTSIATSGQFTGAFGGQQGFADQAQRMQAGQAQANAIQNADSRSERERLQREAIETAAGQDVAANESEPESEGRRGGGFGRRLGGALGGFGGGGRGRAVGPGPSVANTPAPDTDSAVDDAAVTAQVETATGLAPQVMRADHLMTIAEARGCAWVKDAR